MAGNGYLTKQDLDEFEKRFTASFSREMARQFKILEDIKNNFYDILKTVNTELDERYNAKVEGLGIMSRIRDTKNLDSRVNNIEMDLTDFRNRITRLEKGAN